MKKLLLTAAGVCSLLTTNAQSKGDLLLYGGFNYVSSKDGYGAKNTMIHINPALGYFLSDKWALGIQSVYNIYTSRDNNNVLRAGPANKLVVGPFVRYTEQISKTFFFYTELDLGYVSALNRSATMVNTTGRGFQAALTPAIGMNIRKGFALNVNIGGVGYESVKNSAEPAPASMLIVNFGKALNIGISKFIGIRD